MASYTITTTADQDAIINWVVQNYNTEHGTTMTAQDYVVMRFAQLLAPFAKSFNDALLDQVKTQFDGASPTVQSQVKTLLGIP